MLQSHQPAFPDMIFPYNWAIPAVYATYTKYFIIFGKLADITVYFRSSIEISYIFLLQDIIFFINL